MMGKRGVATHKCSRCGEQGHNRRTCGNAPFLTVRNTARELPKTANLEEDAGAATVNDIFAEFRKLVDYAGGENFSDTGDDTGTVTETATVEAEDDSDAAAMVEEEGTSDAGMTVDEMRTWWALSSGGKTGKTNEKHGGTVTWTEKDTECLTNILNTAVRQNTSPAELKKFMKSFGVKASVDIAREPDIPDEVVSILAKHSSFWVKRAVLQRESLPENILYITCADPEPQVREYVLGRHTLSEDMLQLMWDTPFRKTPTSLGSASRAGAASETSCRVMILESQNCPAGILSEQAWKASTPDGIKERVAVSAALRNPHTPQETLTEVYYTVKEKFPGRKSFLASILGNSSTPVHVLEDALDYPSRYSLRNPTPEKLLDYYDRNDTVNAALSNVNIPGHLIEKEFLYPTTAGVEYPRHQIMVTNPQTPLRVVNEISRREGSDASLIFEARTVLRKRLARGETL